jgi:thioredoxin reductase
MKNNNSLPVAVIGAGAIGLAAAAHLVQRGETPLVFEMADGVAGNVSQWRHVQLFSPWEYNTDKAAVALLEPTGWQHPSLRELPLGGELIDNYLTPLANTPALKPHIHTNAKVVGVSRRRIDKMKNAGRDAAPFVLQVVENGEPKRYLAKAVIDASGVWASPNPLGSDGLQAPGEWENAGKIHYGIPDIHGKDGGKYAGKTVAVVGGGHSAINAILELGDIMSDHPTTKIHWILRKGNVADTYGGLGDDALPGRGKLGIRIKEMVNAKQVTVHTPVFITRLDTHEDGICLVGDTPTGETEIFAQEIIAATGARPDFSFLRELRLNVDPAVEATPDLAPLIDPNFHSCGTVRAHGEAELRHPEKDFYIVGNKSYGRAPTFLLATGYEQVRSVVAMLVGDEKAAREVQLNLPETGVCGVPSLNVNDDTACCTPALTTADACCTPTETEGACCTPVEGVLVREIDTPRLALKPIPLSVPIATNSCC